MTQRLMAILGVTACSLFSACSTALNAQQDSSQCQTFLTLRRDAAISAVSLKAQFDTQSGVSAISTTIVDGDHITAFAVADCRGINLSIIAYAGVDTLAVVRIARPNASFSTWHAVARIGGRDPRTPPSHLEGIAHVESVLLKSRNRPGADTMWVYWVGTPH